MGTLNLYFECCNLFMIIIDFTRYLEIVSVGPQNTFSLLSSGFWLFSFRSRLINHVLAAPHAFHPAQPVRTSLSIPVYVTSVFWPAHLSRELRNSPPDSQPLFSAVRGVLQLLLPLTGLRLSTLLLSCQTLGTKVQVRVSNSLTLLHSAFPISPGNFTLVRLAKKFCLFIFLTLPGANIPHPTTPAV